MLKTNIMKLIYLSWLCPIAAFSLLIVSYNHLFWGPWRHTEVLVILKLYHESKKNPLLLFESRLASSNPWPWVGFGSPGICLKSVCLAALCFTALFPHFCPAPRFSHLSVLYDCLFGWTGRATKSKIALNCFMSLWKWLTVRTDSLMTNTFIFAYIKLFFRS